MLIRLGMVVLAAGLFLGGAAKAELSSHLLVVPRMAVSFGVERDDGLMDRAVEVIRAGEGLVSQVMPLQVAPDPFDVVQLRSVFRQPLDVSQ
jgi:hypothetical protein